MNNISRPAYNNMMELFDEARTLQAKSYTPTERLDLIIKTKPIVKSACREQYESTGAIRPPDFCLVCLGCPIGGLIQCLNEQL